MLIGLGRGVMALGTIMYKSLLELIFHGGWALQRGWRVGRVRWMNLMDVICEVETL